MPTDHRDSLRRVSMHSRERNWNDAGIGQFSRLNFTTIKGRGERNRTDLSLILYLLLIEDSKI